jgi:hypothetical protein
MNTLAKGAYCVTSYTVYSLVSNTYRNDDLQQQQKNNNYYYYNYYYYNCVTATFRALATSIFSTPDYSIYCLCFQRRI